MLVRTVLPKPNSTDSVNNKTLEAIYLLMARKSINYSCYILSCMSKVSSILCLAPLPYSNLLNLVFKHFGVSLNKICETRFVPIITPSSFKNKQFCKTETRDWKFIQDMTQAEQNYVSLRFGQHVKPHLTSPKSIPPPSLLDHILALDEHVYELQEMANKLEYIMVLTY